MKLNDIKPGTLYARKNGYSPAPTIAVAVRKHIVRTRWASNDNGKVTDGTHVLVLVWGTYPRNGERASIEEAAAWPVPTNVNTDKAPAGWHWQTVLPQAIISTWDQHLIDQAVEETAKAARQARQARAAEVMAARQAQLVEQLTAAGMEASTTSWGQGVRVQNNGTVLMTHEQLEQLLAKAAS